MADTLTIEEAAAQLGYTPRQLYRWRESGELVTVRGMRTVVRSQEAELITREEFERLRVAKGEGRRRKGDEGA